MQKMPRGKKRPLKSVVIGEQQQQQQQQKDGGSVKMAD